MSEIRGSEPHAIIRARQRYGIELTVEDLISFARRCLKGEGRMETEERGSQHHALIWNTRVLWIIYAPPGLGRTGRWGTVVTVMPPHVGDARSRQDHLHMRARKRARGRQNRN